MRTDSDCLVGCRTRRGRLGFVAVTVAILMTTVVVLPTQAGYVVTLEQVGFNVVATGTGAIDLSGLTFNGTGGGSLAYVAPISGNIFIGPEPFEAADTYTGFTGPTSFGGGGVKPGFHAPSWSRARAGDFISSRLGRSDVDRRQTSSAVI